MARMTEINAAFSDFNIVKAGPRGVVMEWIELDLPVDGFLIEWSKDKKKFHPLDEVEFPKSASKKKRRRRYEDKLPTSGHSWYRIRSFRSVEGQWRKNVSSPSEAIEVEIIGPAAGDV